MANINVVIDKDTNGFNGVYIYDEVINKYVKGDNSYPYPFIMGYSEGGINFTYQGSQYYWVIPCSDFELIFDKTTNFTKYSGGFVAVTITRILEIKKSTKAGKKIKW